MKRLLIALTWLALGLVIGSALEVIIGIRVAVVILLIVLAIVLMGLYVSYKEA